MILFIIIANTLYCQRVKTFPLWETDIPNSIVNDEYKEVATFKSYLLTSISQVSIPTLTVYLPDKDKANGTSIVVCPGGGYNHLSMNKEGAKVGKWLSSLGITVFILKYRLPSDKIMINKRIGSLQDAQETMRFIRRHAVEYNLNVNRIGVLGFSAGGHLASLLSTKYDKELYIIDEISAKPDFCILIYPVISMKDGITHNGSKINLLGKSPSTELIESYSNELHVNEKTPRTFLVHATDDIAVPVENSINYYLALLKVGVPVELHLFEKGGHGFGLAENKIFLQWKTNCENWLKSNRFI
ncbi:alpha/beta hydrolase [uncultured Formosa sp.]|uniref:alpha/beta hydrolase n=1 Tax=uncultured Formosa sp. TaxID=255435 RepID=UPI002619F192|nr:alpha/beta hydrolase [uncultured Formosa sp.]